MPDGSADVPVELTAWPRRDPQRTDLHRQGWRRCKSEAGGCADKCSGPGQPMHSIGPESYRKTRNPEAFKFLRL